MFAAGDSSSLHAGAISGRLEQSKVPADAAARPVHIKPLYALRGGEAGRRLYRWFRRLELPHDLCARAMGRWALPILSR